MLAAAHQRDDLHSVALAQLVLGMTALGHQRAVDLDGAGGAVQPEGSQRVGHGANAFQGAVLAIDLQSHGESVGRRGYDAPVQQTASWRVTGRALRLAVGAVALAALLAAGGCRKAKYDTSTPDRMVKSMQRMVRDGRPEMLLDLVWLEPRPIEFSDGVTEASAIEDVRTKAKDMVAQLWRVSRKLNQRFPKEVQAELAKGGNKLFQGGNLGDSFGLLIADPFGWLDDNEERLVVEDLGDGTASIEIDGAPVLGGALALEERPDGWRLVLPVELVRSTEYFPDTREEWSVVAFLMLAIENALTDFENELDAGKFRSLSQASERVGRLVAEGAAAQVVIYALMQQNQPGKEAAAPAAGAGQRGPIERDLGRTGDQLRKQFEKD